MEFEFDCGLSEVLEELQTHPIVINETEVECVSTITFLGVHISVDLSWNLYTSLFLNKVLYWSSNGSMVKALGYSSEGQGFQPQHHQAAPIGTLSKVFNPLRSIL